MEINNSDEFLLLCEENHSRLGSLEQFLYQMVSNSVKELCFEYETEKKDNPSPEDASRPKLFVSIQRPDEADVEDLALAVVDERKQLGRKIKNHVTSEKVVCFDIPEDFDVGGIKNIEEIKNRLGKWRIQRRQRDSKMNDTYYCHLASRQTCRSVPEVLNFIIYGPKHKRSASDIASTSQGVKALSKMPSKKQDKNQNLEENCGPAEKFATLEEAKQKLAHVELEGVTENDDDHFQRGVYFSKLDPVNYLLDYDWGTAEKFATLEEAKQKLTPVELKGVTDVEDDHFQHAIHFSEPDPVDHLLDYDYDIYYDDVLDVLFRD